MRRRPSTSRSATASLPTMPIIPHMVVDSCLDEVGNTNARRPCPKALHVTRREDAAVCLRGDKDQGRAQLDAGLAGAQVRGATRHLRRYLANRKVAEETRRLRASR